MKNLFAKAVLFTALACSSPAMAQEKLQVITGKVVSFDESLPLEGVSIRVKNSSNATGTQADGSFSLALSPTEKILLLSLPGYEKKELTLTGARDYDIVLKRSEQYLYKPCEE